MGANNFGLSENVIPHHRTGAISMPEPRGNAAAYSNLMPLRKGEARHASFKRNDSDLLEAFRHHFFRP
jgi:hypothetical protein